MSLQKSIQQKRQKDEKLNGAIELGMKQLNFNYSDALRVNSKQIGLFHKGFEILGDERYLQTYSEIALENIQDSIDEHYFDQFDIQIKREWLKLKHFFEQKIAVSIFEEIIERCANETMEPL